MSDDFQGGGRRRDGACCDRTYGMRSCRDDGRHADADQRDPRNGGVSPCSIAPDAVHAQCATFAQKGADGQAAR